MKQTNKEMLTQMQQQVQDEIQAAQDFLNWKELMDQHRNESKKFDLNWQYLMSLHRKQEELRELENQDIQKVTESNITDESPKPEINFNQFSLKKLELCLCRICKLLRSCKIEDDKKPLLLRCGEGDHGGLYTEPHYSLSEYVLGVLEKRESRLYEPPTSNIKENRCLTHEELESIEEIEI